MDWKKVRWPQDFRWAIGESVAHSKCTHSRKPELSTIEYGHQMDGWLLCARLCTCPEIFPELNSVQTLQKSFRWDYKLRSLMCIRMQNDHIRMLKTLQSMSEFSYHNHTVETTKYQEFSWLWKHQNNPAGIKSVRLRHESESSWSSC